MESSILALSKYQSVNVLVPLQTKPNVCNLDDILDVVVDDDVVSDGSTNFCSTSSDIFMSDVVVVDDSDNERDDDDPCEEVAPVGGHE